MDRPAAPTAAGLTARPYHVWTGRSGRAYVHGVYAPEEAPHFARSSFIAVRRRHGKREVLLIGAAGEVPELAFLSAEFAAALAAGADEIHVRLAGDPREAAAVAADLEDLDSRRRAPGRGVALSRDLV